MNCSYNITVLSSVMPPVLSVEFILGAVGNGFALWIFCFHLKPWRSSTVLLFSLALFDALLLVALPFRISYFNSNYEWKFGSIFCKICIFLVAMNRSGSMFFLIAIALDRYMRVVHPHNPVNSRSLSKSACGAAVLWLVTAVLSAFLTLKISNQFYCGDFISVCELTLSSQSLGLVLPFNVCFLVFLFFTVRNIHHLRRRQIAQQAQVKRALTVMIAIVIIFVICFLPSNITLILFWFKASSLATRDCAEIERMITAYTLTMTLVYLNSALDPVVYFFSSTEFRSKCRDALGLQPSLDSVNEPRESSSRS